MSHLLQQLPHSPLITVEDGQLPAGPYPPEPRGMLLEVTCSAPSAWDRVPAAWPRVPGNVVIGRSADGALQLVPGFLPCGGCEPCRAGLHLACHRPWRPGWNAPGGMGTTLEVPADFLVPLEQTETGMQAETAVLLAAAGPTYQAAAAAGMAPGDTVLLLGSQGPGDLPSRLLDALGIRAVPVPAPADHPSASGGTALPRLEDLPSARRHLLDLAPTEESVGLWAPLAAACISCTLVGPVGPAHLPRAEEVLGGQTVVRRVRDLHPHLALDLAALVMHRRIDVGDTVEIHDLGGIADTLAAFARGEAGPRWPVMARAGQR